MSSWYNEGIGVKIAKFTEETGHTAADIIQDAEIVAELKKNNPKLIEYLSNNQTILDELIGYVSELPAQSDSEIRRLKLPMAACELLQLDDVEIFMKMVFESQTDQRLTKFFKLLESQASFQSILPSYFSRVFEKMCKAKYYDSLVKYLKGNTRVIDKMLEHSDNPSISKCIKTLVLVDDKDSYGDIENWSGFKQAILDKAFKLIEATLIRDPFLAENILELFSDVIQRNLVIYHKNDLLATVLEPNKVQVYYNISKRNDHLAVCTLKLMTNVFMHLKKLQGLELSKSLENFLQSYTSHIHQIIGELSKPTLKVVELLEVIIHSLRISRKIFPESCYPIFNTLFKIFFEYPQNNIFHTKLDRLMYVVFEQQVNQPLVDYLFRDVDIIGRTTSGIEFKDRFKSNFGYLIRIARHYTSFKIKTPIMDEAIQKNKDLWTTFSKNILEPHQTYVTKDLGSYNNIEDKDNTNNPNLYTVKSNVTTKIQPNKFKGQEATYMEQAPSSLISLDFMNPTTEPTQQNSNSFNIGFDKAGITVEPQECAKSTATSQASNSAALLPPKPSDSAPPKPPTAPSSAMQSFEQYMLKKKSQLSDGIKSRTPNKVTPNTSTDNPNSARKKNRWQSADKTTESENKPQPQVVKEPPKKLELPVLHIYRIASKNPEGQKTRRVCPKRDGKLRLVLDALNNAVMAQ